MPKDYDRELDFLKMETILSKYNYLSQKDNPGQMDSKKLSHLKVASYFPLIKSGLLTDPNTPTALPGTGR